MSIREAIAWLFDVGDGTEAETRPHEERETGEVGLYGQAEAIRVLYQTARPQESPPKPPRAKRERGSWVARYLDALSSSLSGPVGTET